MKHCITELMKVGISQKEINQLTRENPAFLVGLK